MSCLLFFFEETIKNKGTAGQLGPCATITEPARLEPVLRNKRGRDSERPAHRDEEWPPLATTLALAQKRRPNTAINK